MNRWICCALFGCMGFAMCHMEAQNTTMEGERQHASGSTVDVLTLTNGTTLLGEVTEENGEYVRFNDLSGKLSKLIYKEQIKEIDTTTVSGKQLKALTGKRQKRTVRPNPILRGGNFGGDAEGSIAVGSAFGVGGTATYGYYIDPHWFVGLGTGLTCRLGITHPDFFGAIPLYAAGKYFFDEVRINSKEVTPFVEAKLGVLFAVGYGAGFYGQLKGGLEFNNRFKLSVGLCLDTHPSWETEYYHDHEVYRSATVAGAQFQASFGYCF